MGALLYWHGLSATLHVLLTIIVILDLDIATPIVLPLGFFSALLNVKYLVGTPSGRHHRQQGIRLCAGDGMLY